MNPEPQNIEQALTAAFGLSATPPASEQPQKSAAEVTNKAAFGATPAGAGVATTAVAQPPKPKKKPTLAESDFQIAEQKMNQWCARAALGVTPQQAADSEYWTHVSGILTVGDLIHVRAEDMTWYMQLMVTAAERGYARVHVLELHTLQEEGEDKSPHSELFVSWKGLELQNCVVRRTTGEILRKGFRTKADATMWLAEHLREKEGR